jgi:integrase
MGQTGGQKHMVKMIKLVRCQSGSWQARKIIPADVRLAYRALYGGHWHIRKRWPAGLAEGKAKAAFTAWLSTIEARIAGLREGPALAPVAPASDHTGEGREASGQPALLSPINLFDAWQRDRQPAEATIARWRAVLVELTRRWPDAAAITPADAKAWLRGLVTTERSAGVVRDVWRRACSVVFGHCVEQELIGVNPFAGVKVNVQRGKPVLRDKSFSTEELRLVLAAASASDVDRHPERRWIPWLQYYSGARGGEICQLRREDIQWHAGSPCMVLTPEAGSIKTQRSRVVPIHLDLSMQGFTAWAETHKEGPLFYVPDTKRRSRPQSVMLLKSLQRWLREDLKRQAFRAGITEKIIDEIVGHAPLSIGRGYGRSDVTDLVLAMLEFPKFEL